MLYDPISLISNFLESLIIFLFPPFQVCWCHFSVISPKFLDWHIHWHEKGLEITDADITLTRIHPQISIKWHHQKPILKCMGYLVCFILQDIISGFDQEAAAVVMARQVSFKMETEVLCLKLLRLSGLLNILDAWWGEQ